MHLAPLIQDLAVILGIAGLMSLLFHKIRQPVVLGYIVAGMIVGPHTPPVQLVTDIPSIQTWAELGVIFLMFSLGLEFSFRKLGRVGASAALTVGVEVLFFLPAGFALGRGLGWSSTESVFLGAMLSISSTTIIIKALEELKLKSHRFAELIFGILIVEDLVAVLLLVLLATVAGEQSLSGIALLGAASKLVLVIGGWFLSGYFLLPRFMRFAAKVGGGEMLTLLSLGLCLGLVVFASFFDYSPALGAFIMGSILAETPVLQRVEARIVPLRDLFGAIFFVSIGMLIDPRAFWEHKGAIALVSLLLVVGKIFCSLAGNLLTGQSLRTSVRVGFGLAQIGEFSFIIVSLGMSLGATGAFLYPVAVAVSLITTFMTPYLIQASEPAGERLAKALPSRWLALLERYALWSEARRTEVGRDSGFTALLSRWLINGVVVSIAFIVCAELLLPFVRRKLPASEPIRLALAWFAAVSLSAPFFWGMFSALRNYAKSQAGTDPKLRTLRVAVLGLVSLLWLGLLNSEFFPVRTIALIAIGLGLVLFGFFYSRLETSYHWFERAFLASFDEETAAQGAVASGDGAAGAKARKRHYQRLAPWDAHLVRIQVHPNAPFSGKRLSEIQLRNRHGINVVAIQRGSESMVAPRPEEIIFPQDELLVLGSDEKIAEARPWIEAPAREPSQAKDLGDYELRHVEVGVGSGSLLGKTIRESGIREQFGSMVVGIERLGKRIISPNSDFRLQEGDLLWVVGSPDSLARLQGAVRGFGSEGGSANAKEPRRAAGGAGQGLLSGKTPDGKGSS